MPTIAVKTLGCKVNQYDTEAMLELFEKAGYESVPFEAEADVYLVNTCTVTGTGDSKSLKLIRRLNREHPQSAIIAAGCLTQRAPEKLKLPGVRLLVGVQRRGEVVELLKQAIRENRLIDATAPLENASFENLSVSRHEGKTRATMKIQEGCNRYCSYCIIPYVRGPVRSMPLCAVEKEAARLRENGYKEIVVTGIHLASYGLDTGESLLDALKIVSGSAERIRLGSLEPRVANDGFARALSQIPGICDQFHLSLQSGCDETLRRMNRRYTAEEYLSACESLRRYFPSCAITTDVIVGFPGETDEAFEESCAFVRRARLARLHVFPYSRRSGTVADKLPTQVPEEVKKLRCEKLIAIGNTLEEAYVKETVGQIRNVLLETPAPDGSAEGHLENYVRCRVRAQAGEIKRVRIVSAQDTLTYGEIIE
ncbi:MAG: tRNA (N(6)-L-threonylcarbamoyladenosine(37)-C(2))-methylthiotransferase MtaB [Clostridia bacterium]|nr:tRNA (N(6)-L-threonylcarbamoyladenosine(37)-C(2))-methylthiotransferase MtaB [Clostridia bacterium]